MNEPTPDEIRRVDAWREAKRLAEQVAYREERLRREAEIRAQNYARLRDVLVGRRIVDVDAGVDDEEIHEGSVSLDGFGFKIVFDDHTRLELETEYETSRIEVTFHPAEPRPGHSRGSE